MRKFFIIYIIICLTIWGFIWGNKRLKPKIIQKPIEIIKEVEKIVEKPIYKEKIILTEKVYEKTSIECFDVLLLTARESKEIMSDFNPMYNKIYRLRLPNVGNWSYAKGEDNSLYIITKEKQNPQSIFGTSTVTSDCVVW